MSHVALVILVLTCLHNASGARFLLQTTTATTSQNTNLMATPIGGSSGSTTSDLPQCSVASSSQLSASTSGTYPMTVAVDPGQTVRLIFANDNLSGGTVTSLGEPAVIFTSTGSADLTQSGGASPVVNSALADSPSSDAITQSSGPTTTAVPVSQVTTLPVTASNFAVPTPQATASSQSSPTQTAAATATTSQATAESTPTATPTNVEALVSSTSPPPATTPTPVATSMGVQAQASTLLAPSANVSYPTGTAVANVSDSSAVSPATSLNSTATPVPAASLFQSYLGASTTPSPPPPLPPTVAVTAAPLSPPPPASTPTPSPAATTAATLAATASPSPPPPGPTPGATLAPSPPPPGPTPGATLAPSPPPPSSTPEATLPPSPPPPTPTAQATYTPSPPPPAPTAAATVAASPPPPPSPTTGANDQSQIASSSSPPPPTPTNTPAPETSSNSPPPPYPNNEAGPTCSLPRNQNLAACQGQGRRLKQAADSGLTSNTIQYVALMGNNTVPGFFIPNTTYGVPYIQYTAPSAGSASEPAVFNGTLMTAQMDGNSVVYPLTSQGSPNCMLSVTFVPSS